MPMTEAEKRQRMALVQRNLDELETDGAIQRQRNQVNGYGQAQTEEDRAFDRYLRSGDTHGMAEARTTSVGLTDAPTELGAGSDASQAGYTVPQSFWTNLQVALKAYGGIANDFRLVETPNGRPMPWPTVDPTAVTAGLQGVELTQVVPVDPYVFGQGMLSAYTYVNSPILVSVQLAQDSAFDVGAFIAERMGEAIGRSLAVAAVSGTGSSQPLGLITGLNTKGATSGANGGFYGLTAATTVKTFAGTPTELTSNTLSPQTLIAMMQSVDPAYYDQAKWYLNSNQAWNLHGVVDSQGRPLLNFANGFAGNGSGQTNGAAVAELFGFPVVVDNSIPNLVASTTGGPIFGNLQHAMVQRRVMTPTILRLQERFADFLAVGYIGWLRVDYRTNDLRAAVTVKPAAT